MLSIAVALAVTFQPSRKVEERVQQILQTAIEDPSTLEFIGASEKWACDYKTEEGTPVRSKFGVFRTHVRDEFDEEFSIVQADSRAIIAAKSTYGVEDVEGTVTKWYQLIVIDKKDRSFRQISESFTTQRRFQRIGRCAPY